MTGKYPSPTVRKVVEPGVLLISLIAFGSLAFAEELHSTDGNAFRRENRNKNDVFLHRPFSNPPTVRPPPYSNSLQTCPELNLRENWEGNLCGNLNGGEVPLNPMGHEHFGQDFSYPFEMIKNKTLEFFRHALPVLKTYKALPKVARYGQVDPPATLMGPVRRRKRDAIPPEYTAQDEGRALKFGRPYGFTGSRVKRTHLDGEHSGPPRAQNRQGSKCENAVFCKLLNTMYDRLPQGFQRLVSPDAHHKRHSNSPFLHHPIKSMTSAAPAATSHPELVAMETNQVDEETLPQTPCPSMAEYVTPVFARNHEGAWRYVVQIPREGYFTQTVEVTKCIQSNCLYMEGSCRTSPRWQSLLVAEMYYPDAAFPLDLALGGKVMGRERRSATSGSVRRVRRPSSTSAKGMHYEGGRLVEKPMVTAATVVRHNGTGEDGSSSSSNRCDGYDQIGCYQFRLFYDWFLIPGECKCWRKSFGHMYG